MSSDHASLKDAINFMIERIEEAKTSPSSQLAALDEAKSTIPYIKSKLGNDDDSHLLMRFVMTIEHALWDEHARQPHGQFLQSADKLIKTLVSLRDDIDRSSP